MNEYEARIEAGEVPEDVYAEAARELAVAVDQQQRLDERARNLRRWLGGKGASVKLDIASVNYKAGYERVSYDSSMITALIAALEDSDPLKGKLLAAQTVSVSYDNKIVDEVYQNVDVDSSAAADLFEARKVTTVEATVEVRPIRK